MAGVLALFAAAPVRLLDPLSRDVGAIAILRSFPRRFAASFSTVSLRRVALPIGASPPLLPRPHFAIPSRLSNPRVSRPSSQANAETKRVRAKEAVAPKNAFTKGTGKAPRAFLKDEKAEVLTAYGLTSLPGQ